MGQELFAESNPGWELGTVAFRHYYKKSQGDFSTLDCNKGKRGRSEVSKMSQSLAPVPLLIGKQNKDKHSKNELRPDKENKTL